MAISPRPPANGFVRVARKVYNPIGFSRGYNFTLWFIFAGALMGFILARLMYLDYHGIYCSTDPEDSGPNAAAPGECWTYNQKEHLQVGIRMHLYTIIPAGFLVCFQFVPAIRRKVLLFHRINGYVVVFLSLAGTIGALMIAKVAFGGGVDTQAAVGFLAIVFLGSLAISYYNIKKLQIEQHRAWMLRAWFYAGAIITNRLILVISALITSQDDSYHTAMKCDKLGSFYDSAEAFQVAYPSCTSPDAYAIVKDGMSGSSENFGAALYKSFGMALWLALSIHAIGVEIYLQLTPAEYERLRNISYQRQLEAGFKNPGRAGLTVDRLGDSAAWVPSSVNDSGKAVSTENAEA
ncbi:hypothetical protein AK830_g1340 [Neonectria ditissima]|uniref:Microtubule associated protein n=1 Tax=Neonectria ditissima TaxID=78410 RepID=A0A0N8H8Q6_9HYPO|nr:hypothetical protein AK830_g1340 [Neonectria ditissima]